ncbi:MAG: hypothetical protein DHS20C19_20140 [Acidimicrobiales bacterium]|nr:MAG: hypothetical protein DHS20C19_20140 [Acidimicrobiales bacterium]
MSVAPILLAVVVGVVFGFIRRGRLASIARTRVRHPEFLAVAVGCSLFVDMVDTDLAGAIALVGLVGGLFFAVVNIHLVGMLVITVGIVLNLLPVVLNGAMPVRGDALVEAEMVTADELPRVTLTGARELETDSTLLPVLGDTFPVRWTSQVVSIGDLIMVVGLADLVANLMLQRRRRRLPVSALPALEAMGWHEERIDVTGDPVEAIDLRDTIDVDALESPTVDLRDQPSVSSTSANPAQD